MSSSDRFPSNMGAIKGLLLSKSKYMNLEEITLLAGRFGETLKLPPTNPLVQGNPKWLRTLKGRPGKDDFQRWHGLDWTRHPSRQETAASQCAESGF